MDPFHDNRMASCSDDGNVKIWDVRNASEPILSFYTGPKTVQQSSSTLVRIQFSPQRAGQLASLTKDASCLKVWNIQEGTVGASRPSSRMEITSGDNGMPQGSAAASLLSRSHDREGLHTVRESESSETEVSVPILWKSRRGKRTLRSTMVVDHHSFWTICANSWYFLNSKSVFNKAFTIICLDSNSCL